jgi:hypothetical protein
MFYSQHQQTVFIKNCCYGLPTYLFFPHNVCTVIKENNSFYTHVQIEVSRGQLSWLGAGATQFHSQLESWPTWRISYIAKRNSQKQEPLRLTVEAC